MHENHRPDELLTLDEVAAILKVSTSTLRTWRSNGTGPTLFRAGKYLRCRRSALEEFIHEREQSDVFN